MKLLDCCSINPKKVNQFNGIKKYIATGDIINNNIITYSNVTYENRPSRANIMISKNDVLFAKMKNTKKVLLGSEENIDNIYSTGFYCLTPNDKIKPKLLYYYLCSELFNNLKDNKCTGATMKGLNDSEIKSININLPQYNDQEKVIRELDLINDAIENRKEAISDIDQLIKSSFISMFGNLIKNERNWNIKTLNELCKKITDGKHGGCKSQKNSGFYFIGATEINNKKINYEGANQITEEDFKRDYTRCDLTIGDVLIVNTGATIGKTAIATDKELTNKTLLQKSVALLRPNNKEILPEFLQYCFICNEHLYKKGQGCARKNLLISQIKETKIFVPPLSLQNEFVLLVEKLEKQKKMYENDICDLEELMESKMYEYFN